MTFLWISKWGIQYLFIETDDDEDDMAADGRFEVLAGVRIK